MLSLVQPTQSETHTHACVDDTRGVCEDFPKVTLMANREAKKERKKLGCPTIIIIIRIKYIDESRKERVFVRVNTPGYQVYRGRERWRDVERTQVWIVQRMSYRCVCVCGCRRTGRMRKISSFCTCTAVCPVCLSLRQSVR